MNSKKTDVRPDEVLESMAATFRERGEVYGDNYLTWGRLMAVLHPDGIDLRSEDDFNRFGMYVWIVAKLQRFASSDLTHIDSIHDLGAYAAMLESWMLNQRAELPPSSPQPTPGFINNPHRKAQP